MIDYEKISQVWIVIFGCLSIWFVGRLEKWSRWGYVFGLIGQPAFLYTSIAHEQWGVVAVCLWYTYSWAQGINNHFFKKVEVCQN